MKAPDSAYLGPLGGLVRFASFKGGLSSSSTRAQVEKVTTGGVRRLQVSPLALREWSFSYDIARPSDFAGLAALVAGEFGYGPFWFVDPWAQVTNLLDPRSSVLEWPPPAGLSVGGPVALADGGRAGRSMVVESPTAIVVAHRLGTAAHLVPVIPGQPVTGSVYASGAGPVEVRLTWWDAANTELSSTSFASFTPGASMARLHRTAVAPANAASVSVGLRGATRFARPAVTWTDKLVDWHVGQGAPSVAIPADLSQSIILAHTGNGGRLASLSTTIREIG